MLLLAVVSLVAYRSACAVLIRLVYAVLAEMSSRGFKQGWLNSGVCCFVERLLVCVCNLCV